MPAGLVEAAAALLQLELGPDETVDAARVQCQATMTAAASARRAPRHTTVMVSVGSLGRAERSVQGGAPVDG